jgi:hypothetical protein
MQHAIALSQEPKKKSSVMRDHVVLQPSGFVFRIVDIYAAEYADSDTRRQ